MTALLLMLALGAAPKPGLVTTPPPSLVMVRTPGTPAFERTQQRLYDELTLLLDSFVVILQPLDQKDFAKRPLAEQMSVVLPLSKSNDAVAVVWLAEPLPGQVMLHLVAQGTGRTLVRTLDFDRRSQSENVLALMLRELLGTAFLYEPAPTIPVAVRSVVSQVRQSMPSIESLVPPPPRTFLSSTKKARTCSWCPGVSVSALVESGLTELVGPSTRVGASAAGAIWLEPLNVGIQADLLWMNSSFAGVRVGSISVPVLATASLRFRSNSLEAGPRIGVGTELSTTSKQTGAMHAELFTVGPAFSVGGEAQWTFAAAAFVLRLDFFVRTRRPQLVETTSNSVEWALNTMALRVSAGVEWEGF